MRRLWYCDHHELPLPAGHKFPAQKYRLLREELAKDGRFCFEPAPFATAEEIEMAHDPAYVRAFLDGSVDAAIIRRIGFPWSEGMVRRTLASVGGTLRATEDALARGWGGTLAGGTHHAFYAEGSGFCVFNDLAIAIQVAGRRAAVIDLDVHQGDGTAAMCGGNPEVFTLSLHGGNNFPFRKQKSTLDVALADGTGDEEYLEALRAALPRAFGHGPEIVFYQAGVDGLGSDKLGRLSLTATGLQQRDRMVFEGCLKAGVPCVVTLGGGYSEPIERTVTAHAGTFRMAAEVL